MPLQSQGKIQLYTGNGKGKTTAALGTALRAHAQGQRVVFVYFDKGGDHYSEEAVLKRLGLEFYRTGLNRINPQTGKFRFGVTEEDKKEGKKGLEKVRQLMKEDNLDLLVLDEINISVYLGIIDESEVLQVIKNKPKRLELILTGRNAPQSLIDLADLVTDMQLIKHYFYEGKTARKGVDY